MWKYPIIIVLILFVLVSIGLLLAKEDTLNTLSRKKVEYLDSDYTVSYSNDGIIKRWTIRSGKVTSTDKGYYYFWNDKNKYIQVPMNYTVIEEL